LALLGIEALVFIGMVAGISIVDKLPLAVIINTSASAVVVGFFSQVIRGPLGEELGWRGYAQNELEKKHSPLTSALIVGVVWGFWHTPLWLVTSGYTGGKLLAYCGLFLIGLVSISVIMAYFYGKTKNLVIPMVIHQLLNFLGFLVVTDGFEVMLYMSSLYLIAALVLIVANRRTAFVLNQTAGVAAPSASAQM
jgi:membrane protease YdiL (CAAX protease family)